MQYQITTRGNHLQRQRVGQFCTIRAKNVLPVWRDIPVLEEPQLQLVDRIGRVDLQIDRRQAHAAPTAFT